jgi:CheY-like chemotaxis protein
MATSLTCSSDVRVLLVEDDADLRAELAEVLEDAGYAVVQAVNGREGLARLESMPAPSVVLLDLMMPVMSGEEMLTELRKHESFASVPVILMSAYHERARLLRGSVQGLLEKPVRPHVVVETVEHVRAMSPVSV